MSNEFVDKFRKAFQSSPETAGDASLTLHEAIPIIPIYRQIIEQEYGGGVKITQLDLSQREYLKDLVTNHIIEHGWPVPGKTTIGPKAYGTSAAAHLCVVAESLLDKRGPEAVPDTVWSYNTKNQFDRFVAMRLIKQDKFRKKGVLFNQWYSPQDRQAGYHNPDVKYPEGLDDTKIYGVAKPHRYFPAQLLRQLEEIRLGKMSEDKMASLGIDSKNLEKYKIPWKEYNQTIDQAETIDDITVGIALKTIQTLKKHGLSDKQIATIIVNGYNPQGPIKEHGNIPQVHKIWGSILNKVKQTDGISSIHSSLQGQVEAEFEKTGHKLEYYPER